MTTINAECKFNKKNQPKKTRKGIFGRSVHSVVLKKSYGELSICNQVSIILALHCSINPCELADKQ